MKKPINVYGQNMKIVHEKHEKYRNTESKKLLCFEVDIHTLKHSFESIDVYARIRGKTIN